MKFAVPTSLLAALLLSACAGSMPDDTSYAAAPVAADAEVSRAATDEGGLLQAGAQVQAPATLSRNYKVADIEVIVPDSLSVSEANSYKPRADIIWREDPLGDRRAQVDALVTEALSKGVAGLDGDRPVKLVFELSRFHALTEKTRYSLPYGFRATHDIRLTMAVYDAETGALIEPARPVGFEIEAHTNGMALADEARGITQRSRISDALIDMVRRELAAPHA